MCSDEDFLLKSRKNSCETKQRLLSACSQKRVFLKARKIFTLTIESTLCGRELRPNGGGDDDGFSLNRHNN